MPRVKWQKITLHRGYVLLANRPVEEAPKHIWKTQRELQADVEEQVKVNRNEYIVGITPIRTEDNSGFLGWIILAARAGKYGQRARNLLFHLQNA